MSPEHQWTPWNYQKRVSDADKVAKKNLEIVKSKTSISTQRSKLASYISTTLKSRQERVFH